MIRTRQGLYQLATFAERYDYCKLGMKVGADVHPADRLIMERFYQSYEWRSTKRKIYILDNGCNLGCEDRPIADGIIVFTHHLEPITPYDVLNNTRKLTHPDNLITTTFETHNAIHYGDGSRLLKEIVERKAGDTCPWKHH